MSQENRARSSWTVVGCAWVLSFAMFSRILCLPPMGHIVREALLLSHGKVGLIFSLPLAILAAIAIPSGVFGDKIGPRKAAGTGAIIMTAGSLATGTVTNFMTLFVFTCMFGIGFSLIFTNLPKLIGLWFPREKVGLATGIYVTGIATGAATALAITLPVVFPITNTFRGTFLIWSLPAVAAAILWWILVKEPPSSPSRIQSQQVGGRNMQSHLVWKNRNLWLVALAFFCLDAQFYTWTGWTPKLMMLKGARPDLAALMSSSMQWVSIPVMFLMPWAAHKVGLIKPFIWGSAIAITLASWSAIYIPVPLGWPLMVVLGIGVGTFPLLLAFPVALVPEESVGTASGMVISIGYIGALVGPWLAGYILDVTGTLDLALVVLIGVGIAWSCIGLILPETGLRARVQS